MLHNAVLRADDELLCITVLRVIHDAGGASLVIRLFRHLRQTFRMNEKQRIGMRFSCSLHILYGHAHMSRTATLKQLDILLRHLLCHPVSQVAVRDKQNILILNVFYDLNRGGRRHAHVADGLKL